MIGMILLSGCVMPPAQPVEKSRVISAEYDVVWKAVVSTFANEGMTIKTMDKETGVVNATSRQVENTWVGPTRNQIFVSLFKTSNKDVEVSLNVTSEKNSSKISERWESWGTDSSAYKILLDKIEAAATKKVN